MENTLHPVRHFYRQYLARYAWARKVKTVVLRAWFSNRHVRHVTAWHLRHSIHKMIYMLSQCLQVFGHAAMRLAHRLNEQAAHNAKMEHHRLFFYAAYAMSSLGGGAVRLASWMQQVSAAWFSFFSMVSLHEYCNADKPATYTLAPAETAVLTMPSVHPAHYRQHFYSGVWPSEVPAVLAIEIHDAEVLGKCDFIFTRSQCLHHGLYKFECDLPAEEINGMISIDAKRNLVNRYVKTREPVETLSEAISLIGSASANYAHWLTETAPKLALIDELPQLSSFPLIVDADLHTNILESLQHLNTNKRKLVSLKRGQICKVDKLITITPVAYVPFDFRRGFKPEQQKIDPDWAMFVPSGLLSLRHELLSRLVNGKEASGRLFLRRNSQFRQMKNAMEVEALLHELGFQVVESETLSFADQVKLFSSAGIIVAQAGAALGNIIFAPVGCHVVILSAWSPVSNYYYFSNLASILGQLCTYVLCNPDTQDYAHPAHKGFAVDIHTLREAIGR